MSKPKKLKLTPTDIRAALEKHYGQEAVLVYEVANATGGDQRRRIDAIAVGVWPSRGLYLHAIEIKVSRGDFLRELKNPEKAESVASNCTSMMIAAPKGMIKPDELPEMWGLYEVSEAGRVYTTKGAGKLDSTPDHKFYVSLVRAVVEQRSERNELEAIRAKANSDAWSRAEEHFKEDRERLMAALGEAREKLAEFQSMIGRYNRLPPAEVGRLLEAIRSLNGDYGALNAMAVNAQKIVDEVGAIEAAAKAIFAQPPAP